MSIFDGLATIASKYGPTAFGVVLGFLARYAELIDQGRDVTRRVIITDLLIFGMVTSLATAIADLAHMPAIVATPFGAMAGFSGLQLCRLASRRFFANASAAIDRVLPKAGDDA